MTLAVEGDARHSRAGAQLTVFRLVQEALTNSLKHAGPKARAAVTLRFDAGGVDVEVSDDGTGERPAAQGGHGLGLSGMRERAAVYAGTVEAGPRPPVAGACTRGSPSSRRVPGHEHSVLLVDDQPLLRAGFRMVIESQDDLTVVGEAGDGAEAVRLAAELDPDVVLMDVRMPEMDGIEATLQIVAAGGRPRVSILTTFDLDEYAFAGLRAGASGFLLKDVPPNDLLTGIRAVAAGDAVVAPSVTRRLLDSFAHRLPQPAPAAGELDAALSRTDRARARGAGRARTRTLQRGDRRAARALRGDRQDPRRPHPGQARPARSRPGRGVRLRDRSRPAVPGLTTASPAGESHPARPKETSRMSKNRWTVIAACIAGVAFVAIAIVYFAEPAKSLPAFFPAMRPVRSTITSSTASPR